MAKSENRLYSIYENGFNDLETIISNRDEVFMLLNDLLIYSSLIACDKISPSKSINDNVMFLLNKYDVALFSKLLLYLEYEQEFIAISNKMVDILKREQSENAIECLLGVVLEKHINRKDTGAYYTPEDTTQFIAKNTIISVLLNKLPAEISKKLNWSEQSTELLTLAKGNKTIKNIISGIKKLNIEEKIIINDTLNEIKIIDPTCGSGAFIICAFDFIINIKKTLGILLNDVEITKTISILYGVDISHEAIFLTKARLTLKIVNLINKINGCKIILDTHFVVADALNGDDYYVKGCTNVNVFNWNSFGVKFDCIIGNPPYVEYRGGEIAKFKSQNCGNLYAYTIERAINICEENGIISFIVPLPFITTPRMNVIKDYLVNNSACVYFSTYADRPGCVFKGVHQRLVIFFAKINRKIDIHKIYTTKYHFWYNNERDRLFVDHCYVENDNTDIPKFGNAIDKKIYQKLHAQGPTINDVLCGHSSYPVYLSSRIGFWAKSFLEQPSSKEFKTLYTSSQTMAILLNAFFNTSTFYYNWIINSDCWHVNKKDYEHIYFNTDKLSDEDILIIEQIHNELMADLEKNKKYIGSKQVEFEYKHKKSKAIIDKIDDLYAKMFGFTKEEISYIKNYTLCYRMNKE